jgi:phosphonate transport system permease protein
MGRLVILTAAWLGSLVGLAESSQVGKGLGRVLQTMLPLQLAERTEVARIEHFDPYRLPWFARIEPEETREVKLNPTTFQTEVRIEQYLGQLRKAEGRLRSMNTAQAGDLVENLGQ